MGFDYFNVSNDCIMQSIARVSFSRIDTNLGNVLGRKAPGYTRVITGGKFFLNHYRGPTASAGVYFNIEIDRKEMRVEVVGS